MQNRPLPRLEKLSIEAFSDIERTARIGAKLEVQFNPEQLSLTHSNDLQDRPAITSDAAAGLFANAKPRSLNLKLVFDGTDVGRAGDAGASQGPSVQGAGRPVHHPHALGGLHFARAALSPDLLGLQPRLRQPRLQVPAQAGHDHVHGVRPRRHAAARRARRDVRRRDQGRGAPPGGAHELPRRDPTTASSAAATRYRRCAARSTGPRSTTCASPPSTASTTCAR
jgi:hypothetical protein